MSAYIKLSTQEYPRHIGDIEIDPVGMSDYAPVEWIDPPQINFDRQIISQGAPVQVNGTWKVNWVVSSIPDSEGAMKARAERNRRLSESDWSQGKDIPDNISSAWATYRQALRDVPTQAGFPWDINWPNKPE